MGNQGDRIEEITQSEDKKKKKRMKKNEDSIRDHTSSAPTFVS